VVELLHMGDFLAFSNYPQVDDVSNFGLLESALFQLDEEMAIMGVSIAKLTETRQLICELPAAPAAPATAARASIQPRRCSGNVRCCSGMRA
jgi:hypothetical protein